MLIVAGGPMFSGKTTWLLEYARKLPKGTYKLYKPSIDTRYGNSHLVSHNGKKASAGNINVAHPVFPRLPKVVDTILIDELNFFHPKNLLPAVNKLLQQGKTVIGAGLVYDFEKKPFGATSSLAHIADTFTQLYAVCEVCGKKAEHSYRKTKNTTQVLLGGKNIYGAVCTSCWEKVSLNNQ